MSKTQVAVQSQGPGNTHQEGTYLQLGSHAIIIILASLPYCYYCTYLLSITPHQDWSATYIL